jgi:hypothetical protein
MIKLKNLLNEVSYDKSGLEKPHLADRNKDKKISSWEKNVAQKIEKNVDEGIPQDEYMIGMKKYTVGRPQQYPAYCDSCGSEMMENMCVECDYMDQNMEMSKDHEVGMAQNLLQDIIKNAQELMQKIGDQEIDLPGWIQDHISQAQNYIDQANVGYHELRESRKRKK